MNELITFVGFRSSGKNTAAQPLIDRGFTPLSFADAMKDSLASIFCWDRDLLEGITDASRTWRETVDPWWANCLGIRDFTPRWAMRHFGTDIMRKHFNPELWVLNVERRILLLGDRPIVIIDARFDNEITLTRKLGGRVARIQRGPDPEWLPIARQALTGSDTQREIMRGLDVHESEWSWLGSAVDVTLSNDSSIDDLHCAVLKWVTTVR